jgi:hypothetical protein
VRRGRGQRENEQISVHRFGKVLKNIFSEKFWRGEKFGRNVLRHCENLVRHFSVRAKKEGTMNRAPTELNAAR